MPTIGSHRGLGRSVVEPEGEAMTSSALLWDLGASAHAIRSGTTTSARLVRAAVERATALEPELKAFARFEPERAKRAAAQADRRHASGAAVGSLQGVPVAVKDIFDT